MPEGTGLITNRWEPAHAAKARRIGRVRRFEPVRSIPAVLENDRDVAISEGSDTTVTDISEQLPATAASAEDAASTPNGAATPTRAKRASLNTMLLSELQQLAGGMGISTAKLKKSDLIAAIKAAQSGDSAPAKAAKPARKAAKANAPQQETLDVPAQDAPKQDAPKQDDTAARDRGQRERRNDRQDDRQSDSNRESNRESNRDRNQGGGGNQDRNQSGNQDRNQDSNRDRGNNQQNSNNQQNNQNNNDRDDDYEGGRRRGRRYRDRRGRNRDRAPGGSQGGGNADVEPTVSEDDVLIPIAGILDEIPDKNTWFVRTGGYYASPEDVYVANSYVRRFNLRRGDAVTGAIKQPREGDRREKYNPLVRLDTVNGRNPDELKNRVEFTRLTPLYPQERLRLETEPHILTTRVIDLVMPIGKGQRALIVSPPKAGKTMVLQAIANAISVNNPEVHLMVVLIDERPEEVTDMQRSVKGEVIASTFDRRPQDHITVAELSIERAKRLVEMGHDVVVLLDSITRLGRAYNLGAPASGRILSGGVDSTALYPPKRFLGAARNIENGGSLTILATALVETGSAGDTVIFEEFKGTGNAELKLDRKIADKRVFPAVDVDQSSTRKEEILLSPDELAVTIKLRRVLHALESQQAIDLLLDRLKKTRTNIEFLMQIAKTSPGQE
jgi:transcription termination factor Rho